MEDGNTAGVVYRDYAKAQHYDAAQRFSVFVFPLQKFLRCKVKNFLLQNKAHVYLFDILTHNAV